MLHYSDADDIKWRDDEPTETAPLGNGIPTGK